MKKSHIYITALAAALSGPQAVWGAEPNLRTEINVDRTVVPVQRPAAPMSSVSPTIVAPKVEAHKLRPAEYGEPSAYDNVVAPLPTATYTGLQGRSPYRGYAALGYFPSFNLGASAGYRILNTEQTVLGAWLQYDGLSYKAHGKAPKNYEDKRQSVKQHTLTLGADLVQRLGKRSRLNASVDYTCGSLQLPLLYSPGPTDEPDKRSLSALNATLSYHGGYGVVAWHAGLDFDHFSEGKNLRTAGPEGYSMLEGASENRTGVRLGAFGQFSKSTYIGLEATADFLHRSRGLLLLETGRPSDALAKPVYPVSIGRAHSRTPGIIKLMPYFGARGGRVNVRLGVDVNFVTANIGNNLHIAPNVLLDWNPASTVAMFAKFSGGDSFNSLRSLYTRMGAGVAGSYVYTTSNTPVSADFGFNIGPFKGAALELHGGYACTHNAVMPIVLDYASGEAGALLNTNLSGWRVGGALSYTWRDLLKARASFDILAHSYNSGFADAYDRARTVTKIDLSGRPLEKLELTATYELRTGRRYYSIPVAEGEAFAPEARTMRNSSELNIGARYTLTDALSVGIRAENLLGRRAEILPWVPGQGVHGLVGVELKF
ncbi:MAG: hypothetical protein K2M06_05175 [Muribaculaceae bacterium]|nr:hypothetical protein [Muribaculaceae bacterium]